MDIHNRNKDRILLRFATLLEMIELIEKKKKIEEEEKKKKKKIVFLTITLNVIA